LRFLLNLFLACVIFLRLAYCLRTFSTQGLAYVCVIMDWKPGLIANSKKHLPRQKAGAFYEHSFHTLAYSTSSCTHTIDRRPPNVVVVVLMMRISAARRY